MDVESAVPALRTRAHRNIATNVATSGNDAATKHSAENAPSDSSYDLGSAFSPIFHTQDESVRFTSLTHKNFVDERKRKVDIFTKYKLTRFLEEKHLLRTVDYPYPYYRDMVLEF